MFTIIGVREDKNGIFSRRAVVSQIKDGMLSYSMLGLKNIKAVNHVSLQKLIGKSRVVMTDDVKQSCKRNMNLVDDHPYSYKLMVNGIKRILKLNSPIDMNMSVTLVDIHSRYQALADILLKHFNTVRIITNRKELYQHYVISRLYDCGATVMLSQEFRMTPDIMLIVSPDGIIFKEMVSSTVPVITLKPVKAQPIVSVHSFQADTPIEYKKYLPSGINEHEYQTALYECCGIRGLAALCPTRVTVNNLVKSVDELKINLFSIDIK